MRRTRVVALEVLGLALAAVIGLFAFVVITGDSGNPRADRVQGRALAPAPLPRTSSQSRAMRSARSA